MQQNLTQNDQNQLTVGHLDPFETFKKIGFFIAEHRLKQEKDLSKIASVLKIRKFFLECIEQGRLDQLPGKIYAVGFIRSYLKHLHLDDKEIINALLHVYDFETHKTSHVTYSMETTKTFFSPWIICVSVVLTGIGVGYCLSSTYKRDGETQKIIQMSQEDNNAKIQNTISQNTSPSNPLKIEEDHVYIRVTKPTWMKISNADNRVRTSAMLNPNTMFDLTPHDQKTLTVGDVSALQFYVGNNLIHYTLDPKLLHHNILENFPLHIQKFLELHKKEKLSQFEMLKARQTDNE